MSTSKAYCNYILKQLDLLDKITVRAMMGEYLLYHDQLLFGGIYNEKLLVKKGEYNQKYNLSEQIPYQGAKPMYLIDELENKKRIKEIILDTCKGLLRKK